MQKTEIKNIDYHDLCFTIDTTTTGQIEKDCNANEFTSEFYSVSTEIIKSCPEGEYGSCMFTQGDMIQVNKYYKVSISEEESISKFCKNYGGEWSQGDQ